MPKKLITEKTVVDFFNQGKTEIEIDKNTIVTPSARDKALQLKVKFIEKQETAQKLNYPLKPEPKADGKKIVAIASDHAGFKLKEELKCQRARLCCDNCKANCKPWDLPRSEKIIKCVPLLSARNNPEDKNPEKVKNYD